MESIAPQIAGLTISILIPFAKKGIKWLTNKIDSSEIDKVSELSEFISKKMSGDKMAESTMNSFLQKPDLFSTALKEVLIGKIKSDQSFGVDLDNKTTDIKKYCSAVFSTIIDTEADNMVGVKVKNMKSGEIHSRIEKSKSNDIIGVDLDSIG